MKKKKSSLKPIYISASIGGLLIGYSDAFGTISHYYKLYQNPYRNQEIILENKSMYEKSEIVAKYLEDLSKTDIIQVAYKKDPELITRFLYSILMQNPYTDFEDISEKLMTVKIKEKESLGKNVEGATIEEKRLLYTDKTIYLVSNSPEIYSHELLHTIYPFIEECTFLEEGIVSLLNEEFYKEDNSYSECRAIIRMWIQLIGSDSFWEAKTIGSVEPLKEQLKLIGYDEAFIDKIFIHMNYYYKLRELKFQSLPKLDELQKYYPEVLNEDGKYDSLKHNVALEKAALQLLDDLNVVWQDKYGQTIYDSEYLHDDIAEFAFRVPIIELVDLSADTVNHERYFNTEVLSYPILTLKK